MGLYWLTTSPGHHVEQIRRGPVNVAHGHELSGPAHEQDQVDD